MKGRLFFIREAVFALSQLSGCFLCFLLVSGFACGNAGGSDPDLHVSWGNLDSGADSGAVLDSGTAEDSGTTIDSGTDPGGGDDSGQPLDASYPDDAETQAPDGHGEEVPVDNPWPEGDFRQPIRYDERSGMAPSVHLDPAGQVFLHYNDEDSTNPNTRRLYQRIIPPDSISPGDSVALLEDGYSTTIYMGAAYYELAISHSTDVLMMRSDSQGSGWDFYKVMVSSDSSLCEGKGPAFYGQTESGPILVFEFAHNSGLFGCTGWAYFSQYLAEAWSDPVKIYDKAPTGLYANGSRIVISLPNLILTSSDNGTSYQVLKGGDLTMNQLGGSGLAVDQNGALYIIQDYNYANEYHIALLKSEDQGDTWSKYHLQSQPTIIDHPRVTATGTRVVVAFLGSSHTAINVMLSEDSGATWTAPQKVNAASDFSLEGVKIAAWGSRIVVVYGEKKASDPDHPYQGVYFTIFE